MTKKIIIILIIAAVIVGLIIGAFLFGSHSKTLKSFNELNNVNLDFSFDKLDYPEGSWADLVPDDLTDIKWNPLISIQANILPESDFNVKTPVINLKPPLVSADNVAKIVPPECAQFQAVSSCSKISNSRDRALCEQCQKEK